ncbi:MAG: hypothetical protein JSR58_02285 [Verrucomicrobia bacterium]|nr:hypothetical protein [Verrucomicrobiota bacterium]
MQAINLIKGNISFPWSIELTRVNSRNIAVAGICLLGTMVAIKLIWDYFKKESASSSLSPTQVLSTVVTHPSTVKIDRYKFFFPQAQLPAATLVENITIAGASIAPDIWRRICEFLPNPKDILHLSQTCKALVGLRTDAQVLQIKWQNHINDLEKIVFGKEAWNTYFGDVGEVDPIPEALVKALEEPCPFIQGKKVKETHIACWTPTSVNGTPLNLNTLGKLVQKPLKGHASKYDYFWSQAKTDHGDKPIEKGHWILLTKTVLEGSRNKTYNEQKQLVESYLGYEVPTVLSTAIALFMHHARTGERLYNDNPLTFTRCQERSNGWSLAIGCFAAGGLNVARSYLDDRDCIGVGGLRKF